jgi:hypothetical protein
MDTKQCLESQVLNGVVFYVKVVRYAFWVVRNESDGIGGLYTDFGVSFPDFPGCVTAGYSIDEAKDLA